MVINTQICVSIASLGITETLGKAVGWMGWTFVHLKVTVNIYLNGMPMDAVYESVKYGYSHFLFMRSKCQLCRKMHAIQNIVLEYNIVFDQIGDKS